MAEKFIPDPNAYNTIGVEGGDASAATVPVGLTFGRGAVYAICRCGKSFFARGSRGVCEYMNAQMLNHVCKVDLRDGDQVPHSEDTE